MKLHIDFETYSACELKSAGLDNYARHPSTGVHCMAWCFDDESVNVMVPPFHILNGAGIRRIFEHIEAGGIVVAHNAPFELAIWNNVMVPKYHWPKLSPSQVRCTMAMAYSMSLPGALEKVAPALGIDQQKDLAGARVMMQLAKPKEDGTFWTPDSAPEKFAKLYAYCKQDVVVEREIEKRMMPLSASEQRIWQIDYTINQRGVQIDLPSVETAIALVEAEKDRINTTIRKITGNTVSGATDLAQLKHWLRFRGVDTSGLAKADITALLAGDLPEDARRVLELRREAAKSSTAKLTAMRDAASMDGRVRGILQYHGAATGRWAGRKIQVQNLPRGFLKPGQVEDAIAHLDDAAYLDINYGNPMDVVSSSLRGMIVPKKGNVFIDCDFSNIEGRALAWLAGENWKTKAFYDFDAGIGADLYVLAYAKSFNVSIEEAKPHRQIGKVQELALGYQGGVGAFQSMARIYGIQVSDEKADEIKALWRNAHPNINQYWYDLEEAAVNATHNPDVKFKAGAEGRKVTFLKKGSFLWCQLPSGRVLCYPYPRIANITTPWGAEKDALHYHTVDGYTGKWGETKTYGGSLAENVTQAVARDLLAESLVRLEDAGIPVVMHVHDEVLVEPKEGSASLEDVEKIMSVVPEWAKGLPLASAGWTGKRYRKD